jgi:hypothetical protein
MFLYYLIEIIQSHPTILFLYFAKDGVVNTKFDETINQIYQHDINDGRKVIYSRVPITEICGLENLCESNTNKNLFVFLQSEQNQFYYAVGSSLDEAINCLKDFMTPDQWNKLKSTPYDKTPIDIVCHRSFGKN